MVKHFMVPTNAKGKCSSCSKEEMNKEEFFNYLDAQPLQPHSPASPAMLVTPENYKGVVDRTERVVRIILPLHMKATAEKYLPYKELMPPFSFLKYGDIWVVFE